MKHVTVVVPVHNEESNVCTVVAAIATVFNDLPYTFDIIFVDDGSTDNTLGMIRNLCTKQVKVSFLSFSRNFGHQAALKAGLDVAIGDCVISMDGDMQHPPGLIAQFLECWEQGYEIVYSLRAEDKKLNMFKRKSSSLFYKAMNRLSGMEIENGSADFRLLDRRVVEVLRKLQEYDLFFRGLVKWAGFKQTAICYEPAPRLSGTSKYTVKKMVRFAMQGITSFSIKPLYLATYLGLTISLLAALYFPYAMYGYFYGHARSGWTSIIMTVAFLGGMQLMILGIIGIYLGKTFMQSKQRPIYIVKESSFG